MFVTTLLLDNRCHLAGLTLQGASPRELSEREVTYPSNLKVVRALIVSKDQREK
jgi:hypothetical protein